MEWSTTLNYITSTPHRAQVVDTLNSYFCIVFFLEVGYFFPFLCTFVMIHGFLATVILETMNHHQVHQKSPLQDTEGLALQHKPIYQETKMRFSEIHVLREECFACGASD